MKMIGPKRYLCISRWLQCFCARVCENIEIHRWKPKNYQVEFRQRTKNFRSKNKFCYFAIFDVAPRRYCMRNFWRNCPFAFDFAKKNPFWAIRYRNPCKHLNVSRVSILIFMTHSAMLFSSLLHCSRCFI